MEPLHFMAFGQLLALQQTLLSALPGTAFFRRFSETDGSDVFKHREM
jgi:hypothetical protein